jgi:hypothetical protein
MSVGGFVDDADAPAFGAACDLFPTRHGAREEHHADQV